MTHTPCFTGNKGQENMIYAYILTLDLESVCLVAVGLGFRVYNTRVTHVKKKRGANDVNAFQFYDHTSSRTYLLH